MGLVGWSGATRIVEIEANLEPLVAEGAGQGVDHRRPHGRPRKRRELADIDHLDPAHPGAGRPDGVEEDLPLDRLDGRRKEA
jgi:hypothetical protein